jgi:hypothetical protein
VKGHESVPDTIAILTPDNGPAAAAAIGHPLDSIGALAELAQRFHYAQVTVHPSAHPALGLPPAPYVPNGGPAHPFVAGAAEEWRVIPSARLGSFHALRSIEHRAGWSDVYLPAFDDDAGLAETDPATMLAALVAFRDAVGVRYRFSPGHTGTRLMLSAAKNDPGPSSTDPPAPAKDGGTESDFHYARGVTLDEQAMPYLHAYDCRARYLASCSGLDLGIGEPEELTPSRAGGGVGFSHRLPGYWRVELRNPPPGPDPFNGVRDGWVTTPTAHLAAQLQLLKTVRHAFVWPHHTRALAPWYTTLAGARRVLGERTDPGAALAAGLLKRTYAIGIGWLAGSWVAPGEELYRPDWRHSIIAQSRTSIYRRLRDCHLDPLAIDVDCVYLPSPHADPLAHPDVSRLMGAELGAFKVQRTGSFPDVLDAIAGGADVIAACREATT